MTERARDKDTVWSGARLPAFPPLATDRTTTVCIVGAGIAGLTTAYLLAMEGRGVIVVDDGLVGGGESGLSTAQLVTALDRRWADLGKLHSQKRLRVAAASHAAAIDRIEHIVSDEDIACDFERLPGYLFAGPADTVETIRAEIEAAHDAGLGLVHEVERAPLLGFDTGRAAEFPAQGQLHVLKYLAGLARAVERHGGQIFTNAHVIEVDEESDDVHVVVKTDQGVTVRANEVVLATNTPFLPRISIHLKQAGYRSYVIAMPVPEGSVFKALYWDTEEPQHYVRLVERDGPNGRETLLVVGGEDHRSGVARDADERHARLEAWARKRFPNAGAVVHRWSGEVMETIDGLAYIGRLESKSRVIIATGDSGDGMTHGTIAAIIIDDLVHGRQNPWADTYSPSRVNLRRAAVSNYVKENLSTAARLTDWVSRGDIPDASELAPGTGAIVRTGFSKLAVYRDPTGHLHQRSAVCPHLGCIVAWNAAERTWDCPCHGSRFGTTGRVLHGPATRDLEPVSSDAAMDPEGVALDAPVSKRARLAR